MRSWKGFGAEIEMGPVAGRSASSILQLLNLGEGTLSVKDLVDYCQSDSKPLKITFHRWRLDV
jgi:hypothetical protein